ncbi:Fur family transcriptional regulator [Marinitenerispora sediminis]|uniref:Transcriptional repressor n=1 Tax=Marinitenerispora sediminis TaxID=1931232 RepID=A0A368T7Q4_9ACTN|nr:Fur family transcriptional regulator [Marinitenerispora sediminis]RCV51084.1 transcriptional repressor [Marinitenerispora sediminis]RCV56581.1 transcriptional repressor [Marinitenerispora sediminis]RCV60079.1 transcriptional repressor [Marinitenerispora sediminis]
MARTWREELRSRGYRVTPQRELVLEAVRELEHATPDAICSAVQRTASGVNLSTVYRTLDLLERIGLVTHTHLGPGSPAYHLAEEADHLHIVCRGCGEVRDVPLEVAAGLVGALRSGLGFEADVRHLTVFGACAGCRAPAVDDEGHLPAGGRADSA